MVNTVSGVVGGVVGMNKHVDKVLALGDMIILVYMCIV